MRILIANSQAEVLERAVDFTALFKGAAQAEVTLMGIDHEGDARFVEQVERMANKLRVGDSDRVTIAMRKGDPVQAILKEVHGEDYNLIVVGTYRNRRFKRGRTQAIVRQLIRRLNIPIVMVPRSRGKLEKVLICTGAGTPGEMNVWVGGTLAMMVGAEVTVLHVMSQLPLIAAAYEADLTRDAAELMQHNTREGRHLKTVLGILYQAGLPNDTYRAKIRHGLVVDEIRREAREGDYDLIVMGAHEVPADQAWNELRELLQDDITGQVLSKTARPVMVVQAPERGLLWP